MRSPGPGPFPLDHCHDGRPAQRTPAPDTTGGPASRPALGIRSAPGAVAVTAARGFTAVPAAMAMTGE